MEVQAALGSDIALVFDECTPFHADREYTARSTERTHRWLDRCLDLARAARTRGSDRLRDRPGRGRGGPAPRVRAGGRRARRARRDRDRRLARRGQGADVRGRRVDDRGAAGGQARATCSGSARSTTSCAASSSASTPSTARCRPGSAATAWRSCPTRRSAGASTWPRPAGSEADEPLLEGCPCPACERRLLPRLPPLPLQGQGADRDAPAHDPQPRLPPAPDGRAARRDRRGPPAAAAAAVRAAPRRGSWRGACGRGRRRAPAASRPAARGAGGDAPSRRSRPTAGARGRRRTTR